MFAPIPVAFVRFGRIKLNEPSNVLLLPVVLVAAKSAATPTRVFRLPLVFCVPAWSPKKELRMPLVFWLPELVPKKAFWLPVVFASPAPPPPP